mmetsp:Transcript_99144/g.171967  ORF Transcript_99144/g.171967 Transcript_99144/m.171967 type:complete len:431 (+) Transcript_99144:75-1367(+)
MFTKLGRMFSQQFGMTEGVCREEPELEPRPSSKELCVGHELLAAHRLHPQEQDNDLIDAHKSRPEDPKEEINELPDAQIFSPAASPEEGVSLESQCSPSEKQLLQLKGKASSAADYMKKIIEVSADEGMSLSQKLMTHKAAAEAALDILQSCAAREAGASQPHDGFMPGPTSEGEDRRGFALREVMASAEDIREGLTSDAVEPSQFQKSLSRTDYIMNACAKVGAAHSGGGIGQVSSLRLPPYVNFSSLCSSNSASSLEHDAFYRDADPDHLILDDGSSYADSEGDYASSRVPHCQLDFPSNGQSSASLSYSCTANGQSATSLLSDAASQCQQGLHRYYSARLSDLSDTQSSGGLREALQSQLKTNPYSNPQLFARSSPSTPTTSLMSTRSSTFTPPVWSMRARYLARVQEEKDSKEFKEFSLLQGLEQS